MTGWNKRVLAYAEPAADPIELLKSVRIEDNHKVVSIDTSPELCNYISKQVQYSVVDFHDVIKDRLLIQLLEKVQVLQLSIKNNEDEIRMESKDRTGYLNEWYSWMHPGISLNVAPQEVQTWREYYDLSVFTRDFLLSDELKLKNSEELPDMVFQKEWWSWSKPLFKNVGEFHLGVNRLFKILGIEDKTLDSAYDSIEVVLNKNKLSVYGYKYYPSGSRFLILLGSTREEFEKHECAIVTEMNQFEEMRDSEVKKGIITSSKFVQGLRGSRDDERGFQATMFIHSPSEFVLPYTEVKMEIDQIDSAFMHPSLRYHLELDPQYYDRWSFKPGDEEIADVNECQLHVEVELSNEYIVDKYEINRMINSKGNENCIKQLKSISNNGMDLELPTYKVDEWGSFIDVVVDEQCVLDNGGDFSVPLHLRYPEPNSVGGLAELDAPWGRVYWACPLRVEAAATMNGSFYYDGGRFTSLASGVGGGAGVRHYVYAAGVAQAARVPRGDDRLRGGAESATGALVAAGAALLAAVAIFKR